MIHTPGKIYLADQRGLFQTPNLRRHSTFNFGDYYHEHKQPFGDLLVVNEEELAPRHKIVLDVEQAMHVVLLPITGELVFTDELGTSTLLDVGQVFTTTLPADCTFQLANPYQENAISFIQIWIKASEALVPAPPLVSSFDVAAFENRLLTVVPAADVPTSLSFTLSLGRFAGRQETVYSLQSPTNKLFAFVLAGAFELEGRLLHEKDGLALWSCVEVELEALSHNAFLLLVEI